MIVDGVICRPDGTQTFEQKEIPDEWFAAVEKARREEAEQVTMGDLQELMVDHEFRLVLLELGV